jgi:hypothetical protein
MMSINTLQPPIEEQKQIEAILQPLTNNLTPQQQEELAEKRGALKYFKKEKK